MALVAGGVAPVMAAAGRVPTAAQNLSSGEPTAAPVEPQTHGVLTLAAAVTDGIANMSEPDIPARIGPCEFSMLGGMVAVRCPREYEPLMRRAGAIWEPGSKRWLIERRRIGPVLRALRRDADPLFRQAGVDLDRG